MNSATTCNQLEICEEIHFEKVAKHENVQQDESVTHSATSSFVTIDIFAESHNSSMQHGDNQHMVILHNSDNMVLPGENDHLDVRKSVSQIDIKSI